MGDEQHRGVVAFAQFVDEIEDAALHRHVQRAGRLVGDDQCWFQCDGDGDQHPLAHAAGQLMRILPYPQARIGQPDPAQKLQHAIGDFPAIDMMQ